MALTDNIAKNGLAYKVAVCCFLAPMLSAHIEIAFVLALNALMGFKHTAIVSGRVLGCYTHAWMFPVSGAIRIVFHLALMLLSYRLSKSENENHKLAGAVLLFFIPVTIAFMVASALMGSYPFSFLFNKERLQSMPLYLFGNMFNYRWFSFVLQQALLLAYLYLGYLVIKKYWSHKMRLYFFTFGAASSLAGAYLWYYVLAPIIY